MKNLALGLVFMLCCGVAWAQPDWASRDLRIQIPFSFIVNDRSLPAGTYDFTFSRKLFDPLMMVDSGGKRERLVVSHTEDTREVTKLVFHKYGDEHFLAEAYHAAGGGKILAPCKREKQLQKGGPPEIIVVAPPAAEAKK